VEGRTLTEDELLAKLKLIASVYKDQAVILRGDENSEFKYNMNVLNVCQKAGIWNIAFATREPEPVSPTPTPAPAL
jgi:biopolymer transport protein ExbD